VSRYTEAEVDAVALAIVNSDRAAGGDKPIQSLSQSMSPLIYRSNARAALAARDALFEVKREKWHVEGEVLFDGPYFRSRDAHDAAVGHRSEGIECTVVHVTAKRRKR
jgi:hypothetical protein